VFFPFTLKDVLKRGALVAAANWPVAIVQATADSLFKLLIAAPLIGGVFLVALVVGAEPVELMSLEWRQLATTIASTLLVRPAVLAAWLAALAVVLVGGSLFVFLVKGGTVGVLARGERHAGLIERPPLIPESVTRASAFSIETFIECAAGLFRRYAKLGLALNAVYLVSGSAYFVLFARTTETGWGMAALLTAGFVIWITAVNLFYLLTQIVIAADDCSVSVAASRVVTFLQREARAVGGVFLIILGLVALATGASILATAALWLVGFVPFIGLTVLRRLGILCCESLPTIAFAVAPNTSANLASTYSYRLMRNFGPTQAYRHDFAAAGNRVAVFAGSADELMFADKYADTVRGAGVAVDVRLIEGIDHMGIVASPKAVAIIAEDVATRGAAAGS